eukprot:gene49766-60607_t
MATGESSDDDEPAVRHSVRHLGSSRHWWTVASPSGRFVRKALIGRGSFKSVYRAFDEIGLLRRLRHDHIIAVIDSWEDAARGRVVFISELCSSGSLTQYMADSRGAEPTGVSPRTIRRWGAQILLGRAPGNIFVNGHKGEVKIGDFGLSTLTTASSGVNSVIGTPEFMAPEIYDERYDSSVDVYSFGMCVLQLATAACPYGECDNVAQVFKKKKKKKVTNHVPPRALAGVDDPDVKAVVVVCIRPVPRPTAAELLRRPFFRDEQRRRCARAELETQELERRLEQLEHALHTGGSPRP